MMMPIIRRAWFLAWFAACPCICRGEEHPFLAGYLDYPQLTERLQKLAEREGVTLRTLGQTLDGREIHQVTIGGPDADSRPAILIVAGLEPRHALGTELALRLAELAAEQAELLKRCTFYILPCANPDGSARLRTQPFRDPVGNSRRTDDDRDGEFGEDPLEDLDADGFLTSIRVYRTGGAFRTDDEDQRLDTEPVAAEGKFGEYDLYSEGIDNDHDDAWNEDAGDGVDLDRNFSFQYRAHTRNV
jgi:hypothetical protein